MISAVLAFIHIFAYKKKRKMKQFLIICLLTIGFMSVTAETYMPRNSVRYMRHHAVYTNEKGEMNVVDINLEWPE